MSKTSNFLSFSGLAMTLLFNFVSKKTVNLMQIQLKVQNLYPAPFKCSQFSKPSSVQDRTLWWPDSGKKLWVDPLLKYRS